MSQSLRLARSIQNTEEIHDALVALATLSLQIGDLPGALDRAREARQLAEARNNFSDTLRPSLIEALALERQGQTSAARQQLLQLEQESTIKPSVRWETQNALAKLAAEMGTAPPQMRGFVAQSKPIAVRDLPWPASTRDFHSSRTVRRCM